VEAAGGVGGGFSGCGEREGAGDDESEVARHNRAGLVRGGA
jgi:hypothetical protein